MGIEYRGWLALKKPLEMRLSNPRSEGQVQVDPLTPPDSLLAPGLLERPVLPPPMAIDTASYKIFVCGKSGVGKTALVAKLAGLEVPVVHHETTGESILEGLLWGDKTLALDCTHGNQPHHVFCNLGKSLHLSGPTLAPLCHRDSSTNPKGLLGVA